MQQVDVELTTLTERRQDIVCSLSESCQPAAWFVFCGSCNMPNFCLCNDHKVKMARGCLTWVCEGCLARKENHGVSFELI